MRFEARQIADSAFAAHMPPDTSHKPRCGYFVIHKQKEVVERVRHGDRIEVRRIVKRKPRIHDELPLVVEKYKEFCATGEVTL